MDAAGIGQSLKSSLGEEKVLDVVTDALDPYIRLAPDVVRTAARTLRDDPTLAFDFLMCLSGVDYIKDGEIELVYHLFSFKHRHRITVKVRVPRENPRLPSVTPIWPGANFHEREVFDLYGVVFDGHPDLRRILLPEDWEGHPLRKDYVVQEEYHGIPVPYYLPNDFEKGTWVFADEMNWDEPNPPAPPPSSDTNESAEASS